MQKYKLMRDSDVNDYIEFRADENEDPCTKALEVLGWSIVAAKEISDDE